MLTEFILTLLTLFILWQAIKRPSNYPPGHWGLPLIGYIPLFGNKSIDEMLLDLKEKHGSVVSWRIGTKVIVIVFDYKLLKEAFLGQDFVDRAKLCIFSPIKLDKPLGVSSSNGIHWHNGRRFALRHLRDLGMGKSRLSTQIQEEAVELVQILKSEAGKPATLPHSIAISVLNVIWQMLASTRYNLKDAKVHEFEDLVHELTANLDRLAIPDLIPWLHYVVPSFLLSRFTKEKTHIYMSEKCSKFFKKFIDEHKETLNPNDPRDFIDAYLIEMEKQKDDPSSTMSIEDLTINLSDLFFGGSETTTTTIKWAIFYLAKNPEVQKRLQKEIDEILPEGTLATIEDKQRLPYTEAFIHETLRYSSLGKHVGIHMANNDSKLGDYLIPKGTFIVGDINSLHKDPNYFESPNKFQPERFLDDNGKFSTPKDGFMPFGVGRRQCLGESLARMELFIFLTTLVQSLNFAPPPGKKVDIEPEPNPILNVTKNNEILITIR